MDEIQDRASSILLLNLRWEDMENVLDSAQSSVEERFREAISKEDEIGRKEKLVKDQFEELRTKEEELGRQFRDLELGKKFCEERLREVELKQKQLEGLQLKEKGLEKRCRDFEFEKERQRKDLEFSVKQCEQQLKEVKLMEKMVKEEIGLKEKCLNKCWREYELKEEQFGLQEKSFRMRYMEFEMEEKSLKELSRDLEMIEKGVQKRLEEIKRKEEEFGQKERDLEQRCRDVELSENCLQKGLKDLKLKSAQCEERFMELKSMEELITTQFEELKEKEEQFKLKMNHFEQCSRDFTMEKTSLEMGHQDLEAKQKHNEECLREIKLKEKQIEESSVELARKYELQFKDLEYKVKQYDQRFLELKLKEKLVKDDFEQIQAKEQQLGLKERHFEQCSKDLEFKEKCIEQRYWELESKEKHCTECLRKVELREKEIEEVSAEHRRKYEQQSSELEFNIKKCEQRIRDLDLKEKKLVEWSNELESKSLALALHPQVKNESAGSSSVKYSIDHSSPAHLRFCVYMDGKDLQMFLNECRKEHGSIGTEVAMALQLAADPAKLVLDAMEGFYPPHLSKGDKEFEGDVARRSCILLLEQLMKLSPEVKPHVKNEAMKLAFSWITKMRVESGHELEVLGFLRLLASFQLAGAFDAAELVNFLVFVAQHIQTPELFKVLGLGDKITGFIRKLVEKRQHMEAIRFIYAFEQVNEFPPVPVLKDFLSNSEAEARTVLKTDEANTKRIVDMRAVVKCIEDNKLESEYLPHNLKSLKNLIVTLENEDGSGSLTFPEANSALCSAPVSETSSQQQVGIKRPREFLATEIAGNVPLGATTNVSSNSMSPKHLKRSKQGRMMELNPKRLQEQDSEEKYDATISASAITSSVVPASIDPATISTAEQQENGSKCPRTALSQMQGNLDGFPLSDLHTNPNRKAVADYYSWKALARAGDQVST
ncbi:hypothetical protein V6N13_148154 [Hibiscus sabdariffa]|uniref:FRIGIDA-like protein n=1 Tax=Hibiscus sabdariffa TaxID=183260 RepID=A0ABR2TXN1_9ROSI